MATAWPDYIGLGAAIGEDVGQKNRISEAVAAPGPPAGRGGKRLRLDDGASIRRQMAKVYREMRDGSLDMTKGKSLIYSLEVLSRAVEREAVERLEKRLDAAERDR